MREERMKRVVLRVGQSDVIWRHTLLVLMVVTMTMLTVGDVRWETEVGRTQNKKVVIDDLYRRPQWPLRDLDAQVGGAAGHSTCQSVQYTLTTYM